MRLERRFSGLAVTIMQVIFDFATMRGMEKIIELLTPMIDLTHGDRALFSGKTAVVHSGSSHLSHSGIRACGLDDDLSDCGFQSSPVAMPVNSIWEVEYSAVLSSAVVSGRSDVVEVNSFDDAIAG